MPLADMQRTLTGLVDRPASGEIDPTYESPRLLQVSPYGNFSDKRSNHFQLFDADCPMFKAGQRGVWPMKT